MARSIDPKARSLLIRLADSAVDGATSDGVVDRELAEERVLQAIRTMPEAMPFLRAEALRFAVYEHVRYVIRNRKPDGSSKGPQPIGGGDRALISVRPDGVGRRYKAKTIEALSDAELIRAATDANARQVAADRERAVLAEEASRRLALRPLPG